MTVIKNTLTLFLLILACSNNTNIEDKNEKVLVRVGDRVITVRDFISRMELTPRPFYCRGTSEKDKAIALNAMIAEKMMALEAGSDCQIFKNDVFSAYIKGRKEQLMRDKLYEIEAMKKVKLDSLEVIKGLDAAQMNYEIEFYMLPKTTANHIEQEIDKSPNGAKEIFKQLSEANPPKTRKVTYLDNDVKPIQDALFTKALSVDDVVGPINIDDENSLFMRVKDFKYSPAVSSTGHSKTLELVVEKLTFEKARQHWTNYVNNVMHGKKIEFERSTFEELLRLFSAKYNDNKNTVMQIAEEMNEIIITQDEKIKILLNKPFFKINDKGWSVADFRRLVMSHPIVFRDDEIHSPREFVKAFRTAVLDVIQDHYLNQEAYKRKFDKMSDIKRKTLIWQDAFVAKYQQEKYLESIRKHPDFDPAKLKGNKDTYIDIYIDSLQQKYQSKIELNIEEYKKIKLIGTDLYGLRPKIPYPDLVPPFPANAIDNQITILFGKTE